MTKGDKEIAMQSALTGFVLFFQAVSLSLASSGTAAAADFCSLISLITIYRPFPKWLVHIDVGSPPDQCGVLTYFKYWWRKTEKKYGEKVFGRGSRHLDT